MCPSLSKAGIAHIDLTLTCSLGEMSQAYVL